MILALNNYQVILYAYHRFKVAKLAKLKQLLYKYKWKIILSLLNERERMEIKMTMDEVERFNYTSIDRNKFTTSLWN